LPPTLSMEAETGDIGGVDGKGGERSGKWQRSEKGEQTAPFTKERYVPREQVAVEDEGKRLLASDISRGSVRKALRVRRQSTRGRFALWIPIFPVAQEATEGGFKHRSPSTAEGIPRDLVEKN